MALKNRQTLTQKLESQFRVNQQITNKKIRLVGSQEIEGVYEFIQAIQIAEDNNLDLVEVGTNGDVSICKLVEFEKFIYERKKKEKEKIANNKIQLKEIRFGVNIAPHDVEYKTKNAIQFLTNGDKVKFMVQFRGREITHKEKGEFLLLSIVDSLNKIGRAESLPRLEGKNMSIIVAPLH